MPIPVRKIKIQLEKAQPTQLTVDTLKQQETISMPEYINGS